MLPEKWNTRTPATPPNAAGAEDAEALLMMALPYAVENFVLPDEIREGIVAAIKVDVESYARHTAAKAVEDERARLRGLVDEHLDYFKGVNLEPDEKVEVAVLEKFRTWLAG